MKTFSILSVIKKEILLVDKLIKLLYLICCLIPATSSADIIDDFSEGGWIKFTQTPSTITTSKNQLIIDDNLGDTGWASAEKTYNNIDLNETPYLIIYVTDVEIELEIKIAGIGTTKSIYVGDFKSGQIVLNMDELTSDWVSPKTGNLLVRIYAVGDGSKVEINKLVITKAIAVNPPANGGLSALAVRSDARRPETFNSADGERVIYKDSITGNEVWRMTKDSKRQRHTYCSIKGWNSNGSKLIFITRPDAFGAGCRIMNSDGSDIKLLPPELGSGISSLYSNGYWSYTDPNIIYYRIYNPLTKRTTLLSYNVSTDESTEVGNFICNATPPTESNDLIPPHPSDNAFCFIWGKQDIDNVLIAIYDKVSGTIHELTPGIPYHSLRFTKNSDLSVCLSYAAGDWIIPLTGAPYQLSTIGTHRDWTSDGLWAMGWLVGGKLNKVNYAGTFSKVIANTDSASEHGSISMANDECVIGDAKDGYYGGMIYGVNTSNGIVKPIAFHGSSYGADESTHPGPKDSPDGTKVMYNSDLGAEYSDIYVAVRKRPQGPYNVQFNSGTLSWNTPYLSKELKGYNIYKKNNNEWNRIQSLITSNSVNGLPDGVYAVTAQEFSNLESDFEGYDAVKDDFVDGVWEAGITGGPGVITASRNNFKVQDYAGDSPYMCATKTFPNIDLNKTPYLILQTTEITGGTLQVKVGGSGRTWTSVYNSNSSGVIVIDIPAATGWTQMTGDLLVGIYTVTDGSSVKLSNLRITDTKPMLYTAVKDDFVDGGWTAGTTGGPGVISASLNNLEIEDYAGDSSYMCAIKTFPNIDLNITPYLVIQPTEITGGTLQVKVGGSGRTWTSVYNNNSNSVIVLDIPAETGWTQMTGDLLVGIYTVTDGSSVKIKQLKITDTKPSIPSTPTGLTNDRVTSTYTSLSWDSNTDEMFDHYNVYAASNPTVKPSNATLVGSPTAARFIDYGLTPSTTYYYRITNVDSQGNESNPTSAVSATTTVESFGLIDDFSEGGWAKYIDTPCNITVEKDKLKVEDLVGDKPYAAANKSYFVNIYETPNLVLYVTKVIGGNLTVKMNGYSGEGWDRTTVYSGNNTGTIVIDIPAKTGWTEEDGDIFIQIYTEGDGSSIELAKIEFTD